LCREDTLEAAIHSEVGRIKHGKEIIVVGEIEGLEGQNNYFSC